MKTQYKIALLTSEKFGSSSGVSSVCKFIYELISINDDIAVSLISLESGYNSDLNVRLLSPRSWFTGIQIEKYTWKNETVTHVGSLLSEAEFQRYKPRKKLTVLLNKYDLIQIVSGGPAIANVARHVDVPVCLQIATLVHLERQSILHTAKIHRKIYNSLMLPIISQMEITALKRADHIFADTEYTYKAIFSYVDSSKISIDTIGVDTRIFKPIPEETRTENFILSVGRFSDPRKNVNLLFKAYALLRKNYYDPPKLLLAGKTGPNQYAWSFARELGIERFIEFREEVALEELVKLYQNAVMYILSSNEEGLGIVLLEAMACATPVISTRCGGPDSVISEQVGFLTPVGNEKAMSDKMKWMIENPKQRRIMGEAGRKLVVDRFSKEIVGSKYLDVYNKLLKKGKL